MSACEIPYAHDAEETAREYLSIMTRWLRGDKLWALVRGGSLLLAARVRRLAAVAPFPPECGVLSR